MTNFLILFSDLRTRLTLHAVAALEVGGRIYCLKRPQPTHRNESETDRVARPGSGKNRVDRILPQRSSRAMAHGDVLICQGLFTLLVGEASPTS